MPARPDIGGVLGTAAFGCICGFAVAALWLWPWKPARIRSADAGVSAAVVDGSAPVALATVAVASLDPSAPAAGAAPVPKLAAASAAAPRTFNVIFLTVDTLR